MIGRPHACRRQVFAQTLKVVYLPVEHRRHGMVFVEPGLGAAGHLNDALAAVSETNLVRTEAFRVRSPIAKGGEENRNEKRRVSDRPI